MIEPQPGARIHVTDPFAVPEQERSPVRRLRGRLASAVTLWTATGPDLRRAGLTVSSTLVVDGEPGRLLGVLDPESEVFETARAAGRFAVLPLDASRRRLADRFAGVIPTPGGPFQEDDWVDTPFGPVLADQGTWVGCRFDTSRALGWGELVEATVERVETGDDTDPLLYFRGQYQALGRR